MLASILCRFPIQLLTTFRNIAFVVYDSTYTYMNGGQSLPHSKWSGKCKESIFSLGLARLFVGLLRGSSGVQGAEPPSSTVQGFNLNISCNL